MKIEKRFTVAAPLDQVWRFITAPEKVAACVPGCQDVEALGDSRYKAAIKIRVGPIKTTFNVDVVAKEERPPEYSSYVTTGEEGGRASRIRAESTLALKSVDDRRTEVSYTSDINVVGRLGRFGLGMMKKKADSMGDEFVTNLCRQLEGRSSEAAAPVPDVSGRRWTSDSTWIWVFCAGTVAAALWFFFN